MPPPCSYRTAGRVAWASGGALIGFWLGAGLVAVAGLATTASWVGLPLIGIPTLAGAARGARIRVCTDGRGIAVRNPFRTYRFTWDQVEAITLRADALKFPCPSLRVRGRRRAIRLCAIPVHLYLRRRAVDARIADLVTGWGAAHAITVRGVHR